MLAPIFVLAFAFFSSASGQSIDPSTVPLDTRQVWCTNQKASCPLICDQIDSSDNAPSTNNCDPNSLVYACICSNGMQPNASQYSQTIPYYECTQVATNCANNCGSGDSACVTQCRTATPCGAQDPPKGNHSITSTASSTASATAKTSSATTTAATGFGGPNSAASSLRGVGYSAGTGLLVAGLFAASGLLL